VSEQLGFDVLGGEWARPLVRVTPARLGTWASCPRRYRYTYVEPAGRGGARAANTLGAVVHLALRALFAGRDRSPARAAAVLDQNWSGEGFRDPAQEHAYRRAARTWVADYADAHGSVSPLGLEKWVSVATGSIVAEGRVDRIDAAGADAVIVDYKTGRHVPSPEDARDSSALALYAVATAATLRRPCRRVELHHLPSGTVAAWEHTDASLAAHVERAADGALAAADAVDFPPRVGPHCGTCEVRWKCPEGRAVPAAQPWDQLIPLP
jgi:putative RecB family exonuclease